MSVFRIDAAGSQFERSVPMAIRDRVPAAEYGIMIDEVNAEFVKLGMLAEDMAKSTCCFAIVTVATCGLGAFLGGVCYIIYKARKTQEQMQAVLGSIHQVLRRHNEKWAAYGVEFKLKEEIAGYSGGRRPQPIIRRFIECQMASSGAPMVPTFAAPGVPPMMSGAPMAPGAPLLYSAPPSTAPMYGTYAAPPVAPVSGQVAPVAYQPIYGQPTSM